MKKIGGGPLNGVGRPCPISYRNPQRRFLDQSGSFDQAYIPQVKMVKAKNQSISGILAYF
jgi:hypothetical protein